MTVADLNFDRITPDAPGLVLPVTFPDTTPAGSLRSGLVGRPGKQVLRWQAFTPAGVATGAVWALREEAAAVLLPEGDRALALKAAAEASAA